MKILIAIPAYSGLYPATIESLCALISYSHAHIKNLELEVKITYRRWLPFAHLQLVQAAKRGKFDYILFFEEDVVAPADGLERLLTDNEDIVSGLLFQREPPYLPLAFRIDPISSQPQPVLPIPDNRIIDVDVTGLFFTLIRMSVFESLPAQPFFCTALGADDNGFYANCRCAGFAVYVDTGLKLRHISENYNEVGAEESKAWLRAVSQKSSWVSDRLTTKTRR